MTRLMRYWVNARWTLGWGKSKIFFVFLVGPNLRAPESDDVLSDPRQASTSLAKAIVYSGLFFWALVASILLTIAVTYIAKTWLGFDLISGSSPIPNFLKTIRLCH